MLCRHCGAGCCSACAHEGACEPCVRHAFAVLRGILDSPFRAGRRAFDASATRLGGIGMLAAGIALGAWFGVALPRVRASSAAHATAPSPAPKLAEPDARSSALTLPAFPSQPLLYPSYPSLDRSDRSDRSDRRTHADACTASLHPLATQGRRTDDPHELLARAERLQAAGADLRLVRISASAGDVERWSHGAPYRVVPRRCEGDRPMGVELIGVWPGTGADELGLRDGDVVTAVNGRPLERPEAAGDAYDAAKRVHTAVIELVREARLVVLVVAWSS